VSLLDAPIGWTLAQVSAASTVPNHPLMNQSSTGNLLVNPDFENGYYSYPGLNSIRVPNGWNIRWYTDTPPSGNPIYPFMQPEVSVLDCVWPNCNAVNYPPRINTGQHAVESGKRWANQDVSLYQSVGNVPIGSMVVANAWMSAWVSSCDPNVLPYHMALSLLSDNASGCQPGAWPVESNHMLVGIDPYGGTDPRASTVVWNWNAANPPWWGPYDYYSSTVPAVAVAQAHTVTLFLRGVTVQPAKFNTVYFDTASLSYTFPVSVNVAQNQGWPLPVTMTVDVQTPVSLTQVVATVIDPNGLSLPITWTATISGTSSYHSLWQFNPIVAGRHVFTLTAFELTSTLLQPINVQPLTLTYYQDRLFTPGSSPLITFTLYSPISLTNLTEVITDLLGLTLPLTLTSSSFVSPTFVWQWQLAPTITGTHTLRLTADQFTQPWLQSILVASDRVYLPLILQSFAAP
jgi:hypothetical protein